MSSFERRGFADQLSIDTPEQVALEFPVAGLGSRFVALMLDHLIQLSAAVVLFLLILLVAAATGRHHTTSTQEKWLGAIMIVAFFLLYWCYYSVFEAYWHGQTPGKRVMKLRVIKDSGRQITLFEALTRNLLRFIDYLPVMYLVGVVTMLCNQRNKRLGDLAAGTLVVHEHLDAQPLLWTGHTTVPAPGTAPWAAPLPADSLFPADAVGRLGSDDLRVIETFFARALDLPLEIRAAMAYRILGQMSARMGVPAPEGNPERALESMAVQLRGQGRRG